MSFLDILISISKIDPKVVAFHVVIFEISIAFKFRTVIINSLKSSLIEFSFLVGFYNMFKPLTLLLIKLSGDGMFFIVSSKITSKWFIGFFWISVFKCIMLLFLRSAKSILIMSKSKDKSCLVWKDIYLIHWHCSSNGFQNKTSF